MYGHLLYVRSRSRWGLKTIVLALLAGTLLGLAARVGLFALAVVSLRAVAASAASIVAVLPWADPVYTGALLRGLGEVELQGIAVQGPLGQLLHQAWPAF